MDSQENKVLHSDPLEPLGPALIMPGPRIFSWVDERQQIQWRELKLKQKRPHVKIVTPPGVLCVMDGPLSFRIVRAH